MNYYESSNETIDKDCLRDCNPPMRDRSRSDCNRVRGRWSSSDCKLESNRGSPNTLDSVPRCCLLRVESTVEAPTPVYTGDGVRNIILLIRRCGFVQPFRLLPDLDSPAPLPDTAQQKEYLSSLLRVSFDIETFVFFVFPSRSVSSK
jgi:hypothetical protein